jgi:hypothetical protein
MKKNVICILINTLLLTVFCATAFSSEKVPLEIFSIGGATIGVTTLEEIQTIYGKAEPVRVSRDEEADIIICYENALPRGKSFLIFESGVMGGYKFITGFRLSTSLKNSRCKLTKADIPSLGTNNGVRLGQSLQEFRKAVPVKFKSHGSKLTYENISQRAATPEEHKKLRAQWPDEKQDFFDVTTDIEARFHNNKLVDFYVHKIESY